MTTQGMNGMAWMDGAPSGEVVPETGGEPVVLRIDGMDTAVPAGTTILRAARDMGIDVPSLCHHDDVPPHTSCMVCVVRDCRTDRLLPSCTAIAEPDMDIDTCSEAVLAARREALALLAGEHAGDCHAPCQRVCPAHMDIPLMIRQILAGTSRRALVTVKQHIALPAVLGRICPAPCEKGCRRAAHDSPVGICLLKRFVADQDLDSGKPWLPDCKPDTGKRATIVGAGPAGLAAAYYLRRDGHTCDLIDDREAPGGMLREGVPVDALPRAVLDAEIAAVLGIGITFTGNKKLGRDLSLDDLRRDADAVILATGSTARDLPLKAWGIDSSKHGITVDRTTHETSVPGVFAGGNALREQTLAVRAVAHGRTMALAVDTFLCTGTAGVPAPGFDSRLRDVTDREVAELAKGCIARDSVAATAPGAGFTPEEAMQESERCLRCDCEKLHTCRLRQYATAYGVIPAVTPGAERKPVTRLVDHARVVYDSGKCIDCGICVRLSKKLGEPLGMAFTGRGFDVRVGVPFGEGLTDALTVAAEACVEACPTGALSWKDQDGG